jgi:ornithine cyclodeaminase/alanine dehydrogenase
MPTLFLTDEDVTALADWRAAIDTLQRAYAAAVDPASVPPRSMARAPGIWLRGLTAVSPLDGHLGCKLIAASTRNKCASYLISLFEPNTMSLAALIDGNQITGIRTAATAAVAVDAVAPQRALRVAVLGSGFEARAQLSALSIARDISRVSVFSPTPEKRERFAEEFRNKLGLPVQPMDMPERALEGADVVFCAARARNETPVLRGEWLEPGMTVTSIGSTLPEQREVDVAVIERASLILADMPHEVAHDTGDMQVATKEGVVFADKLVPLSDVVGGPRAARQSPQDIVLYKSVGSALQDVVIAESLLSRARERGIGMVMPVSIMPVAK